MVFDGSMKILTKGTFDNFRESTVDGVIPKKKHLAVSVMTLEMNHWTASIGMFTIDL